MSKETTAREVTTCPRCWRDFTFLEFHLPHCKIQLPRPTKKQAVPRATTPVEEVKAAPKKIAKPGAVRAAVDAKLNQGQVKDEKLRTKRKGVPAKGKPAKKGVRP